MHRKPKFIIRKQGLDWWVFCYEFGWVCPAIVWVHYLGQSIWRLYP